MTRIPIITFFIGVLLSVFACSGQTIPQKSIKSMDVKEDFIKVGAARTSEYFTMLKAKQIGMVVNQTSRIADESIVDSLLNAGFQVNKIFSPEHGFRGNADAGAQVKDGKDIQTGLPIISLYGKNKKPTAEQFENLDLVIFDIQDVGARFYTYISTMHYVMQTCAETGTPLLILDRPNPNGNYIDGPILEKEYQSFVGLHPVPIVHGMTVGEYAKMINGEGWLGGTLRCNLTVVPCENYTHQTPFVLPVKPSPNLPNNLSIYLYPSLCLFEGTAVSVGRGTDKQFQIIGHPKSAIGTDIFTPVSKPGASKPKYMDQACRGFDLSALTLNSEFDKKQMNLDYLIDFYKDTKDKSSFFNSFFTKLAGTKSLQIQIEKGLTANEIRATWIDGLKDFRVMRNKYLLYNL